jgi:hypothetical protein
MSQGNIDDLPPGVAVPEAAPVSTEPVAVQAEPTKTAAEPAPKPKPKKKRATKPKPPVVKKITIELPLSEIPDGINIASRMDGGRLPMRLRKAMKMLTRGLCDTGAKVQGRDVSEKYRPAIWKVLELIADEAGIE